MWPILRKLFGHGSAGDAQLDVANRLNNEGVRAYSSGDVGAALPKLGQAAAAGNAVANFNLAVANLNGEGVERDVPAALRFLEAAADGGHVDAAFELGQAHRLGLGGAQDLAEAIRWYRAAAELGSVKAANELGLMYVEGAGVDPDKIEGFAWIYPGTHETIQYEPAWNNAKQLATTMTVEDVQEAQRRGMAYFERYFRATSRG